MNKLEESYMLDAMNKLENASRDMIEKIAEIERMEALNGDEKTLKDVCGAAMQAVRMARNVRYGRLVDWDTICYDLSFYGRKELAGEGTEEK